MKFTTSSTRFDKIYSSAFLLVMLVIFLSFLTLPIFPLSNISDHFRWRQDLIDFYSNVRFQLGDRVYNGAVIGKDGWIFYTGAHSIEDYQIVHEPRKKFLSDLQKSLDRLSVDLQKQGITLVVVFVPNKSTVYPQYMPDEIPVIGQKRGVDELLRYLKISGKTTVIDLGRVLRDASQHEQIYYKTDSHWNDMGAYYGYVEIMRTLSARYSELQPRPLSDFEYVQVQSSARDLANIMGLPNQMEENWMLVPKFGVQLTETKEPIPGKLSYVRTVINQNTSLPSLLIFHDSFYYSLAHFIEPHFSRTVTIPYTEKNETWTTNWIAKEHPDIVIIEFVERYWDDSLPDLLFKKTTAH